MKNNLIIKRIVAGMLILSMVIGCFGGCAPKKDSGTTTTVADNTAAETTTADNQANNIIGDDTTGYVQVSFAMPSEATAEEQETITLPEAELVPSGTLVCAIEEATRSDYRFNGWYYDAALTKPADGYDAVEKNTTLYPSFTKAQNYDTECQINYISTLDVEPDFEITVVTHGLTTEQVKALLTVTDLSKVEGAEEFVLEQIAPDLEALIADEDVRSQALEVALLAQSGELNSSLSDALEALNPEGEDPVIDSKTIADIVAYYAPAEAAQSPSSLILELKNRAEAAGLNPEAVTVGEMLNILTEEEKGLLDIEDVEALGASADTVINIEDYYEQVKDGLFTAYYIVRPAGGKWKRGDLHQVEIKDTKSLRFLRDGEETGQYIVYYNITVHQDDFNNMRLNSGLIFLPQSEVTGVTLDGGLFKADASNDGEMSVEAVDDTGVLTYTGSQALGVGVTVAVYNGTLGADNTVDGSVGYFEITEVLGDNQYAYKGAEFANVVFVADVIPVKDDGSFDDGVISVGADQLNFSSEMYSTMGLDAETVVEAGDFIAVYTGDLANPDSLALTGYGCITSVTQSGSGLEVHYDVVSEETLELSSDMYMHVDNVDVPLTEEELDEIAAQLEKDVEESGFMEDSAEYIKDLICNEEDAALPENKYSASLTDVTFQRDDGGEITLEEVRELAAGSKVEVEWPPKLSFALGFTLQHFEGTGLRAEAAAEMTITIHLTEKADIKINVVALIEVEVAFGLNIKWEVEWRKAWIFPYIYDISGTVGLHAGIYVGAGITVTVQTQTAESDEDEPAISSFMNEERKKQPSNKAGALTNIGEFGDGLQKIAKLAKVGEDGLGISRLPDGTKQKTTTDQNNNPQNMQEMHNSVGGSFEEKYASFIQDSDAEYVPLVDRELTTIPIQGDPLHLVAISLGIRFVVRFKLNVMLGVSLTYGNAKQISANFTVFHPNSSSTVGDLETPNFRVDFYIFGMVGIRVGFMFDFRIGVISTKLASIGITAEIGVYLEFYGYFYVGYQWESGKGSSTEMFGSLLLQFGVYLDINFLAQAGNGKASKSIDLYDVRFPLLSLGDEFVALDFAIEDDSSKLNIDITKGASAVVPDDLFEVNFLEIDTGEIDSDNMDSNASVNNGGKSFTAMGVKHTQYDETYFHVEFTPLGKNYTKATTSDVNKGGFVYNPSNNTIYAKPNSVMDTELWGEFTFTWYQGGPAKTKSLLNYGAGFGLNTRVISRTVRVHWKGTPVTGTADVYLCKSRGGGILENADVNFSNIKNYYTKKETIEFDGLDGVAYYMDMDGLADRYPGMRLNLVEEQYSEDALVAYLELKYHGKDMNFLQLLIEFTRVLIYGSTYDKNRTDNRGWLVVDSHDKAVYCMMHAPTTKVNMFFNYSTTNTDWYVLDQRLNTSNPMEKVYNAAIAPGYSALSNMPAAIKNKLNNLGEGYEYKLYMYKADGTMNVRSGQTGQALDIQLASDADLKDGKYKADVTYMPALSQFIRNRRLWTEVTADTVIPVMETVFFAVVTPKTYTVTWKYDDGDVVTQVEYGALLRQRTIPSRTDFRFDYWADENGNKYKFMPAKDLVLYPHFTGTKQYTVTWILEGETKTTSATIGANPLGSCPYSLNGLKVNWTTSKGDITTTVGNDYAMPGSDITLYGTYIYQYDWILYDTGNKKTAAISSDYRYQETKTGDKVMDNIPDAVKAYLSDKRYTYSYYRVGVNGESSVKSQISNWEAVTDSTVFGAGDVTYIIQRSPVMVNVTWKYDDGDVTTSNWVGRKLSAPKDITRRGYNFLGWADADGNTYDYPPYEDITLYPQFEEHEHTWGEGVVITPATCHSTGVMQYTCTDCDKTKTEEIAIDPDNHDGDVEYRNASAPTCDKEGYEGDMYCSSCGAYLGKGKTVAALGHSWGAVTYTWSADNTTCTATRVCQRNASHVETETVTASVSTTPATCEAAGQSVYTATFTNSAFATQTKTVAIAATGHNWGEPVITPASPIMEDSGYGYQNCLGWKAGKKVWTCANDPSHTKEEVILVDVKLASETDGVTISGSSVTIDTEQMFYFEESTVEGIIKCMVYPYVSSSGLSSDDVYFPDDGSWSVSGQYADDDITNHTGETLTFTVTYTPADTATYKTLTFTLTLVVPQMEMTFET
ncbi:MAG: InlB B-repeat-containing protein [Lachnospiraceae bacterium]|nr:InlB B-repeat-containing protein [Lachnospiraceae bacterium]